MKRCIACGMPLEEPMDHALADPQKDYCRYCARADGSMQSFEEKKQNLLAFVLRTQGLAETAAIRVVETMMRELPAWRQYYE